MLLRYGARAIEFYEAAFQAQVLFRVDAGGDPALWLAHGTDRRSVRPPLGDRKVVVNMNKRPLSVTIIACLYIVMGAIGFVHHFTDFKAQHPFQYEIVWVELLRLIAIACGVYMLRGSNRARWLALAWIAYHVILSGFHSWFELAVHSLLCAAFAYFLFRPPGDRVFSRCQNIIRPHGIDLH